MSSEPPPFQESARCDVCKCSFNAFRRRHHCRCCGKTLCHEHSSDQMALPQFGIHSAVRVCADCFNNSSRVGKDGDQASLDGVDCVTDTVSRLNIHSDADSKPEITAEHHSVLGVQECKCGMPLCICEAPAPSTEAPLLQKKTTPSVAPQVSVKPKKVDTTPKNRSSTSNSKISSLFTPGQVTNGTSDRPQMDYEVNGEGLREAIKNGDTAAVNKLLREVYTVLVQNCACIDLFRSYILLNSQGVDANYRDKKSLSLLHLAAVFNRTDIAFILMEHGASMDYKNAQGETPLDCAPATLQYKMRMKMQVP